MINRKLHIRFRLAPKSMILDDRELVQVRIFREFDRQQLPNEWV